MSCLNTARRTPAESSTGSATPESRCPHADDNNRREGRVLSGLHSSRVETTQSSSRVARHGLEVPTTTATPPTDTRLERTYRYRPQITVLPDRVRLPRLQKVNLKEQCKNNKKHTTHDTTMHPQPASGASNGCLNDESKLAGLEPCIGATTPAACIAVESFLLARGL